MEKINGRSRSYILKQKQKRATLELANTKRVEGSSPYSFYYVGTNRRNVRYHNLAKRAYGSFSGWAERVREAARQALRGETKEAIEVGAAAALAFYVTAWAVGLLY